jgi:hypothetical protein
MLAAIRYKVQLHELNIQIRRRHIRVFCTTKEEIATDARIYTNVFVPIRAFVALLYS